MDMSPRKARRAQMSEMNVVPYIDVMLVLLVIFMITAPMLTQGVKIELPSSEAESMPINSDQPPLIVSVDANGGYYLEIGDDRSKPRPMSDIVERVSAILSERPDANVYVRGDRQVRYGVVIRLMASLQSVGASEVGLITEPPPEEQ